MKYLSDKIYITYTPSTSGTYIGYHIEYQQYGSLTWTTIYTGRVYSVESTQYLFLNDIIKSHVYNTNAFKPAINNGIPAGSAVTNSPKDIMIRLKIVWDNGWDDQVTDWILCYYKDANLPNGPHKDVDMNQLYVSDAFDLLQERTSVVPRLPRLATVTSNFWFMPVVVPSKKIYENSSVDGDPVFVLRNESTSMLFDADQIWYCRIVDDNGANNYYNITRGNHIYIDQYHNVVSPISIKVADVDECPAPFYAIWMDRTGAYQCQPFRGNAIFKESINTTNLLNSYGETRPGLKEVASSWTLYTEWLNDEQHKAYESILTSPYIYLYDVENDMGHWVNCTDSNWQDKTFKQQKKLFNLNITLKENNNENILY